jgi:hypothetical protein
MRGRDVLREVLKASLDDRCEMQAKVRSNQLGAEGEDEVGSSW